MAVRRLKLFTIGHAHRYANRPTICTYSFESAVLGAVPWISLTALVGGLDSLLGAVCGALIVASAEIAAIQYVNPLLSDVVPFVVLLIVLTIRPWGLFGSREQLDRV